MSTRELLTEAADRCVPGLQYAFVDAKGIRIEQAAGFADLAARRLVEPATTFMAYSMTKTVTAVAVLQLVDSGALGLDDALDRHLPDTPYAGHGITLRQLLTHTAGLPAPIPLRWVHLAAEHGGFDERVARDRVLHAHRRLASPPGRRFRYSNIGYWLLGAILEQVTAVPFAEHVRAHVLTPLGLAPDELAFTIPHLERHAHGYLKRRSLLYWLRGLLTDPVYWGSVENGWLRIHDHYLDGPAFGGLVGTARGFARFVQSALREDPALLAHTSWRALETPAMTAHGRPLPMTLGWHVRGQGKGRVLYKQGGGGGFRGEMRLYPALRVGSVLLTNATELDTSGLLDRVDATALEETHSP